MAESELCNIPLGQTTNISVTLFPVFNIEKIDLKLTNGDYLSPVNNKADLFITISYTSISSDISNVGLEWIFDKNAVVADKNNIKLEKSGSIFKAENIEVPLDAIEKFPFLLGQGGSLSVKILIENIDPIDSVKYQKSGTIRWDYTYECKFVTKEHPYEAASDIFKIPDQNFIIGQSLAFKLTKKLGHSFPTGFKAYILLWESDGYGQPEYGYVCKLAQQYPNTLEIKNVQGNRACTFTVLELAFGSNTSYYAGCDAKQKLHYGYLYDGNPGKVEFNCLLFFTRNFYTSFPKDFSVIKSINCPKKSGLNCIRINRPGVILSKNKIVKESSGNCVLYVELKFTSISPNINTDNIQFILIKKEKNNTFTIMNEFSTHTAMVSPEKAQYTYTEKTQELVKGTKDTPTEIIFKLKVTYMTTTDTILKNFKVIFPFYKLVSDTTKSYIPVMFSGFSQLNGFSVTNVNETFTKDDKYHYFAINLTT